MGEILPNLGGRPKGRFNPAIDWAIAESLYVRGEADDRGNVTFPSFSAIAARAGTSKENVRARAKRYNWATLRLDALSERGLAPPQGNTQPGIGATTQPAANPRARPTRTPEQVLVAYVAHFDRQLRQGKVRADSVGDLDKAVRLLAFVRGEADSRKATHTVISLEVLQRRYSETRGTIDTVGEEVTGVLTSGGDGSLDGDEGELEGAGEAPRALAAAPVRQGWEVAAARVAASGQ